MATPFHHTVRPLRHTLHMWLRRRVETQVHPSSLQGAAHWLGEHTESAAARALDTDHRWAFQRRKRFWQPVDSIVFPFPHEIVDANDADAWARTAERFAAERTVTGDMQKSYFWLLMALLMAGLVGALANAAWQVALFFALLSMGSATFMRGLGQGAFRLAPMWERRALEFRRRSEQLRSQHDGPSSRKRSGAPWRWFTKR